MSSNKNLRENFQQTRPATGEAGEENVPDKLQTELMDYFGSVGVESEMTTWKKNAGQT